MIKKVTYIIINSSDKTRGELAATFNLSPQVLSNKLSRGFKTVNDLVKLCNVCGAKITITTKDGTVITLTNKK